MSAPAANKPSTTTKWPTWLAINNGVAPFLLGVLMLTPSSFATTAWWRPFAEATNNDIAPTSLGDPTLAPAASSLSTPLDDPDKMRRTMGSNLRSLMHQSWPQPSATSSPPQYVLRNKPATVVSSSPSLGKSES